MAKITDLKEQAGDATRVSVFIDGEFALGLSSAAVAALKLKIGMDVDVDALTDLAQTDLAYAKALYYLSFRARSKAEIKRYLFEKGFAPSAIDAAVNKLILYRYIDDEEFALSLAKSYGQKEGKKGVKSRLLRAGIDDTLIDDALNYDELPACVKAAQKYLRSREFDREKLWRHLYTKGFSSDTINGAVHALETEDND